MSGAAVGPNIFLSHSLSHSNTPASDGTPGSEERQRALQYLHLRNQAFEQSKKCYERKDHNNAKKYSREGKLHDLYRKIWNAKAVKVIFERNNRGRGLKEIDLHGLFVEEAKQEFKKRIDICKWIGIKYLRVIVGKGNNSKDGVAKIKPAIIELANKMRLNCQLVPGNVGCLVIELPDVSPPDSSPEKAIRVELPPVPAEKYALAEPSGSSAEQDASEGKFQFFKWSFPSGREYFSSCSKLKKGLLGLGALGVILGFFWLVPHL